MAAPRVRGDARGFVLTGADLVKTGLWDEPRGPYLLETSVPGIFACGDVRFSTVKRVASAVGEGSMAIAFVHQYLRQIRDAAAAGAPKRDSRRRSSRADCPGCKVGGGELLVRNLLLHGFPRPARFVAALPYDDARRMLMAEP